MLRRLHIENYALIEQLDIELNAGFSVITGETGAGKSILLGALGLLCGQRADARAIRTGAQRCIVEAEFQVEEAEWSAFFMENDWDWNSDGLLLRRELTATGRSRSFVNDSPVTLSVMKEMGDRLIDIHSQHQNLLLGKEDFQLNMLDLMAENFNLLTEYKKCFRNLKETSAKLREREAEAERAKEDEDWLRFQLGQLEEARLEDEDEQQELEAELTVLEHAEEIKRELFCAKDLLESGNEEQGVLRNLRAATATLRSASDKLPVAGDWAKRMDSCFIELKDIADELEVQAEGIEYAPERLATVTERLDFLYALERKHHVDSLDALISQRNELQVRLESIDNSDEELAALRTDVEMQRKECERQATVLSDRRRKGADLLTHQMEQQLQPLGMPHVRFEVKLEKNCDELSDSGCNRVTFLFSANKNVPLQDVAHVASGGEIARVMLVLKALMATTMNLPTIVFDEIDTGVSGGIAERMAHIMQQMGNHGRQVISITHLPQIAAVGNYHYKVYKQEQEQGATTHIVMLSPEERVRELAHMLSGEALTDAAIENARELLKK